MVLGWFRSGFSIASCGYHVKTMVLGGFRTLRTGPYYRAILRYFTGQTTKRGLKTVFSEWIHAIDVVATTSL